MHDRYIDRSVNRQTSWQMDRQAANTNWKCVAKAVAFHHD